MIYNLKELVKGSANLDCMKSGGIAVYNITTECGNVYQFEIDLSDKKDVGECATFMTHYDKAIILMRWIRRENDKENIIKIK